MIKRKLIKYFAVISTTCLLMPIVALAQTGYSYITPLNPENPILYPVNPEYFKDNNLQPPVSAGNNIVYDQNQYQNQTQNQTQNQQEQIPNHNLGPGYAMNGNPYPQNEVPLQGYTDTQQQKKEPIYRVPGILPSEPKYPDYNYQTNNNSGYNNQFQNDQYANNTIPDNKIPSNQIPNNQMSEQITPNPGPGMESNQISNELEFYTERTLKVPHPHIESKGVFLYDATNKRSLFGLNQDTQYYPASITKLATALVTLEHAKLDDTVTFSKNAVTNLESGAVTIGISAGDKLTVRDSLYGLLLKSANEIGNGLAEHVGGTIPNFAKMMNDKAKSLGCKNTNFMNPSGLNDPKQLTTPRDMALISAEAFKNPTIKTICGTLSFKFPKLKNVNYTQTIQPGHKMIRPNDSRYYKDVFGGKTGYTSLARNTLVTGAENDLGRLIVVVMKSEQKHYSDTKTLLDYGYRLLKAEKDVQNLPKNGFGSWKSIDGNWHFEKADGTQLKNISAKVDGELYHFNEIGQIYEK